ncbi:MAG TPA: hypothetical protein VI874_04340, partial [Candidatus Norongarragalinales archaeon]|nr:hypothetical protein [Candidatus Norongarragalinales archaeon]
SKKTFAEPLVVIDAVDHNRNVSAVVSRTQLHRFISLSQTLWEQPEKNELFFPKKRTYTAHQLDQEFKKRGTRTFRVSIKRPDVVEDILLPQAERTLSNLEKQFTLAGFSVLSSAYADDVKQLHFLLELAQDNLPAVQKIQGPAVFNEKACREFIKNKKNVLRGPFVQEERLFVEQIRAIRTADALFKKIKKAPVRFGVASHLCRPFKNANIRSDFSGLSKPAIVAFGSHVFRKEAWLSR